MAREVAYRDGTKVRNQHLPYPIVHYPGHYGAFFGFQEDRDSEIVLCLCAKEAVQNYIEYRQDFDTSTNAYPEKDFILSSRSYPQALVKRLMAGPVGERVAALEEFGAGQSSIARPGDEACVINHLEFEESLCHMCNEVVPELRYCHEMYGTKFHQNYGWYIKLKQWEYGLKFSLKSFPLEVLSRLPSDLREEIDQAFIDRAEEKAARLKDLQEKRQRRARAIEEARRETFSEFRESDDYEELEEEERFQRSAEIRAEYRTKKVLTPEEEREYERLTEEFGEIQKLIADAAENEVRRAVGHYEKGSRWTSETILYQLVETEYGDEVTLERHHRPDWLDGLELDIYLPEVGVGIEYQGQQHFEPVDHWGGEEGLAARRGRDKLKRTLCEERDIVLVEFRYDEDLCRELVVDRLNPLIG